MKISVVIPTFNREQFLNRALLSVFRQTRKVDEIIVVDTGSSDDTKTLLRENFPSVKYIFLKNQGVSFGRNAGIRVAKNEWIAFLDSDDEWHKKKIEKFFNYQSQSNKELLIWHSNENWIRNGKFLNQKCIHEKRGGYIFEKCLKRCCMSPSSVIIHYSIFEKYGYFDETLEVCEDYDLWLRVTARLHDRVFSHEIWRS